MAGPRERPLQLLQSNFFTGRPFPRTVSHGVRQSDRQAMGMCSRRTMTPVCPLALPRWRWGPFIWSNGRRKCRRRVAMPVSPRLASSAALAPIGSSDQWTLMRLAEKRRATVPLHDSDRSRCKMKIRTLLACVLAPRHVPWWCSDAFRRLAEACHVMSAT